MPFTGSHPAAVLPLLGVGLAPAGLVVGSMSPDVPYFVPVPLSADQTHSAFGVLTYDVLLGLAVLVVWQVLLAPAAVALAPGSLRRRLPAGAPAPFTRHVRSPRAALLLLASLVVGATTHVLWDSFTHQGRWGVRQVAWLSAQHGRYPGYDWAQYASSLLGGLAVAAWLLAWWRRTPEADRDRVRVPTVSRTVSVTSALLVAGATVLGAVEGAMGVLDLPGGPYLHGAAVLAATHAGAAGGATAVLVAAVVLLLARRREPAEASVRRG